MVSEDLIVVQIFHFIRYCFIAEFATDDDQQWIINDHSGSE